MMLHFAPSTRRDVAPVVLIPSLVNPSRILDLSPRISLARYLAGQGHDVWLVDWGCPEPEERDTDLAGHVERYLLPMLSQLPAAPVLVGYCLGGTLALAAACLAEPRALVTLAAPWDFAAYPDENRADIARLWAQHEPTCERAGYVPMEVLQSGFWALDPARTVAKYAAFADMAEGSEAAHAFIAVEDWANEGDPLTLGAGRDLFGALYRDNATARGAWCVGGRRIDPADLSCPTLAIASRGDRIVPAAATPELATRMDVSLGHVGMIVSGRARETVWEPLSDWIAQRV